jgi:hypothetical protein
MKILPEWYYDLRPTLLLKYNDHSVLNELSSITRYIIVIKV